MMAQKWSVTRTQHEREREQIRGWMTSAERQDPFSDYWRGKAYQVCIELKDEIGKAAADAFIDTFPETFPWKWAFETLSRKLEEVKKGGHDG